MMKTDKKHSREAQRSRRTILGVLAAVLVLAVFCVPAALALQAEVTPGFADRYAAQPGDEHVRLTWKNPANAGEQLAVFEVDASGQLRLYGLYALESPTSASFALSGNWQDENQVYYVALTRLEAGVLLFYSAQITGDLPATIELRTGADDASSSQTGTATSNQSVPVVSTTQLEEESNSATSESTSASGSASNTSSSRSAVTSSSRPTSSRSVSSRSTSSRSTSSRSSSQSTSSRSASSSAASTAVPSNATGSSSAPAPASTSNEAAPDTTPSSSTSSSRSRSSRYRAAGQLTVGAGGGTGADFATVGGSGGGTTLKADRILIERYTAAGGPDVPGTPLPIESFADPRLVVDGREGYLAAPGDQLVFSVAGPADTIVNDDAVLCVGDVVLNPDEAGYDAATGRIVVRFVLPADIESNERLSIVFSITLTSSDVQQNFTSANYGGPAFHLLSDARFEAPALTSNCEESTLAFAGSQVQTKIIVDRTLEVTAGGFVLLGNDGSEIVLDAAMVLTASEEEYNTYEISVQLPADIADSAQDGCAVRLRLTTRDELGNVVLVDADGVSFSALPATAEFEVAITTPYTREPGGERTYYARQYDGTEDSQLSVTYSTTQPLEPGSAYSFSLGGGEAFPLSFVEYAGGRFVYTGVGHIAQLQEDGPVAYSIFLDGVEVCTQQTQPLQYPVLFCGPIRLTGAVMRSNETDPSLARQGSVITLQVDFSTQVTLEIGTVAGVSISRVDSADGYSYTMQVRLPVGLNPADELADNSLLQACFAVTDRAGNRVDIEDIDQLLALLRESDPDLVPEEHTVTYYRTMQDLVVEYTTGNPDKMGTSDLTGSSESWYVVKDGDTLVVRFTVGHPVEVGFVKLGPNTIIKPVFRLLPNDTGDGLLHYEGRFVINGQEGENIVPIAAAWDLAYINMRIGVMDGMGQGGTYSTNSSPVAHTRVRYYAPIVISNVAVVSSNANGPTYGRAGDVVTITMQTSHMCDVAATVGGKGAHVERLNDGERDIRWRITYTLAGGEAENQQQLPFTLRATDVAQNATKTVQNSPGVVGKVTFFAPLEASVRIASNNNNAKFAKNGDTVTVSVTTNSPTTVVDASIGGRGASAAGSATRDNAVSYVIPAGEKDLTEGTLTFSVALADAAGNRLTVSETNDDPQTAVIYDRTAPVISIAPPFTGFTPEDISFTVSYSDTYLNPTGLSYLVNNGERITEADRLAATGNTFTKTVSLTSDGEYMVSAQATDLAGNVAVLRLSASVVVDKTSPTIRIVLERSTFAAGFTLDQLFTIQEKYVQEVRCTVATGQGIEDWTLDTPLTVEGKKTVTLSVRDMAGNTSVPITYDIFIDASPPVPLVVEQKMDYTLQPGAENVLLHQSPTLQISLKPLHVGDETPDRFVLLELVDEDGNRVWNALENGADPEGSFQLAVQKYGVYTLRLQAEDDVGNRTDVMEYTIVFRERSVFEQISGSYTPLGSPFDFFREAMDNRPLLVVGVGATLAVGVTAAVALPVRRLKLRRHKKKDL